METLAGGQPEASGPHGKTDRVGNSEYRRERSDRYKRREPGMEKIAHEQGRRIGQEESRRDLSQNQQSRPCRWERRQSRPRQAWQIASLVC